MAAIADGLGSPAQFAQFIERFFGDFFIRTGIEHVLVCKKAPGLPNRHRLAEMPALSRH